MRTIVLMIAGMHLSLVSYRHQIIKGAVINAGDNTPLVGAKIQVADEPKGTVLDAFDRFELVLEDSVTTLVVSYVGFSDKTILAGEHDGHITVLLEPSTTELSQLQITANEMNSVNSISKLNIKLSQ